MDATVAPVPLERLGRYVLTRSLGVGGMGEVWKARVYAAAGVEKDLCVKRIRRERLARPGAVDRFVDEARLSIGLTHGHIVQVFDFGRAGDEYYIAMEWVDGADLRRILEHARETNEPLVPAVAVHVAACVARALAYAHRPPNGGPPVIHCDIKPANVLVSRAGEVKLTDFGAAALEGELIVAGTRGYMPPSHEPGRIADPRVDLYALGVLLLELLAGDREADAHVAANVPDDLRAVVASLLASDPEKRPEAADVVADLLEAWVSRARAAGGITPSSDLARRAARAATSNGPGSGARPLDVDASFRRDGVDRLEFHDRMSATTATVPLDVPVSASPTPRSRRRRLAAALVASVALLVPWLVARGAGPTSPGVERGHRPAERSMPQAREAPEPSPSTRAGALTPSAERPIAPLAPVPHVSPPTAMPRARDGARVATRLRTAASGADAAPTLPTAAPAHLDVNAVPWGLVELDGRSLGESPLFGVAVTPGEHTVVLSNPVLGARRVLHVSVASGERRRVIARFEAETSPAATIEPP